MYFLCTMSYHLFVFRAFLFVPFFFFFFVVVPFSSSFGGMAFYKQTRFLSARNQSSFDDIEFVSLCPKLFFFFSV